MDDKKHTHDNKWKGEEKNRWKISKEISLYFLIPSFLSVGGEKVECGVRSELSLPCSMKH